MGSIPGWGTGISRAAEQLSPRATTAEPTGRNRWAHGPQPLSPRAASRVSMCHKERSHMTQWRFLSAAIKIRGSKKNKYQKKKAPLHHQSRTRSVPWWLRRPSGASRQRGWGIGRTVGMCPAITSTAKLSSFPSSLIFSCSLSVRQRLVQLLEKQPRVCVREAAKRWMFREKSPKALGMKGYFREGDPSFRTILHRESFCFPLPKA